MGVGYFVTLEAESPNVTERFCLYRCKLAHAQLLMGAVVFLVAPHGRHLLVAVLPHKAAVQSLAWVPGRENADQLVNDRSRCHITQITQREFSKAGQERRLDEHAPDDLALRDLLEQVGHRGQRNVSSVQVELLQVYGSLQRRDQFVVALIVEELVRGDV